VRALQSLTGTVWERELREEYHEALLTAFLGPQVSCPGNPLRFKGDPYTDMWTGQGIVVYA
jgi:hypothetical protein